MLLGSESGTGWARSQAGDGVQAARTSSTSWCKGKCLTNWAVQNVEQRVSALMGGIPMEHAEPMQVLRYETGQYYKQHHDQQTAHWTPQGVRVYTFFVYLSDVEAGGGTKFNDLGLIVTPKRGRAVLWPSVLSKDLLTGEPRTHHEALPVEKGVKYACNLWIHLYDFKTPSRAGICPFLGQNTHGGA